MPPFDLDATTPLEIKKTSDRELTITWKDGHSSVYSFHSLRAACLCANCIDELTGVRVLDPASIPPDIRPLNAQPVGRYGVQFQWSDGHQTGIYAFDYLRKLCPCPACRGAS